MPMTQDYQNTGTLIILFVDFDRTVPAPRLIEILDVELERIMFIATSRDHIYVECLPAGVYLVKGFCAGRPKDHRIVIIHPEQEATCMLFDIGRVWNSLSWMFLIKRITRPRHSPYSRVAR